MIIHIIIQKGLCTIFSAPYKKNLSTLIKFKLIEIRRNVQSIEVRGRGGIKEKITVKFKKKKSI